jgi:hypothetical protein
MPDVKDVQIKKPTEKEINTCKTWPIWTCEQSTFDWSYTQKETCLIIEGQVTVSDKDSSISFGPGDMVIFPKDLDCKWQITKAVKKYYTFT